MADRKSDWRSIPQRRLDTIIGGFRGDRRSRGAGHSLD